MLQVFCLESEVREATRGRDLLSHTLNDRTAQLQLQIKQTEVYLYTCSRTHKPPTFMYIDVYVCIYTCISVCVYGGTFL